MEGRSGQAQTDEEHGREYDTRRHQLIEPALSFDDTASLIIDHDGENLVEVRDSILAGDEVALQPLPRRGDLPDVASPESRIVCRPGAVLRMPDFGRHVVGVAVVVD